MCTHINAVYESYNIEVYSIDGFNFRTRSKFLLKLMEKQAF